MNSDLSTNELFHFTKFDNLIGIINEGFHPHYCLEHTFLSDLFNRPAAVESIPMVSFCDIPFSLIKKHTENYGKVAIGLHKKWGEKYGLNPVIYIHKNSKIGDAIAALGNSFVGYKSSMVGDGNISLVMMISQALRANAHIAYFVKQYERTEDEFCVLGNNVRRFPKGRFYDEREWRFVPITNPSEEIWLIDADTFDNPEKLKAANEKMKKYSLQFQIEDIQYLIYESDEQKPILISLLKEKFKMNEDEILSKVIFKKINEN